jgi:hypothetical protein
MRTARLVIPLTSAPLRASVEQQSISNRAAGDPF